MYLRAENLSSVLRIKGGRWSPSRIHYFDRKEKGAGGSRAQSRSSQTAKEKATQKDSHEDSGKGALHAFTWNTPPTPQRSPTALPTETPNSPMRDFPGVNNISPKASQENLINFLLTSLPIPEARGARRKRKKARAKDTKLYSL